MIKVNLKKVYLNAKDEYAECVDQSIEKLKLNERVQVTIENVPFLRFEFYNVIGGGYELISVSPVSLRTYRSQEYQIERWGVCGDVRLCLDKIISITAGFINKMGKEPINDGNHYKENE